MCDQTERSEEEEEEEEGPIFTHHSIEVNVEILDSSKGRKKAARTVEPMSKRASPTLQRVGRRQRDSAAATDEDAMASATSETALEEELRRLREHYSSQLRRINYVSHEHLGPAAEPTLLACLREPLRGLRLPHGSTFGPTFGQVAHGWWTRVSGWRKLIKTSRSVSSHGAKIVIEKKR